MNNLRIMAELFIFLILIVFQNKVCYSCQLKIDKTAKIIDTKNNIIEVCLTVKKDNKKDIILLIDKSASISNEKINFNIKNACKKFIDLSLKNKGTRICVISFSSNDNESGKGYNQYAYLECDYTDKCSLLKDAVDNIKISGKTNLSAGFAMAGSVIDNQGDADSGKYVVLFTDGVPNLYIEGYAEPYNAAYSAGIKLKEKATLITFGYLKGINEFEKKKAITMLNELSDKQYYDVSDTSILNNAYNDIYGKIYNQQTKYFVEDKITDYFELDEYSIAEKNINYDYIEKTIKWELNLENCLAELKYTLKPDIEKINYLPKRDNKYYTNEYAKLTVKNEHDSFEKLFPMPFVVINNSQKAAIIKYNPITGII